MKLHAVMAVVLLALAIQGPSSAYASPPGAGAGKAAGATTCSVSAQSLADCCDCCSSGAGTCCSAACLLTVGAGLPSDGSLQISLADHTAIPDRAAVLFVGHDPPRPLRPPIV